MELLFGRLVVGVLLVSWFFLVGAICGDEGGREGLELMKTKPRAVCGLGGQYVLEIVGAAAGAVGCRRSGSYFFAPFLKQLLRREKEMSLTKENSGRKVTAFISYRITDYRGISRVWTYDLQCRIM